MSELVEVVRSLAEPVLARHGAGLVDVEVKLGRTRLVRIVADRPGGIDLDTCARVNAELSRMLDVEDPLDGRYTLEVTSPGLDRPLRTAADFRRVIGRRVKIVLDDAQHDAQVESVDEDAVILAGDVRVPLHLIRKARVMLPW